MNNSLLNILGDRMNWLNERQQVLSQNVANADTPGYKPRDLKEFSFEKELNRFSAVTPAQTNSHHLQAHASSASDGTVKMKSYETKPTGNSVVLEQQMVDIAQTSVDAQTASSLYRKFAGMMRTAMGRA
jgi:flagellar basal-body rod protein FlgB